MEGISAESIKVRSPPQDEISDAQAVRHLKDDEVDRLGVEA
ncbi:hypothetical protein VLG2_18850 [Lactobacillus paragasseri]